LPKKILSVRLDKEDADKLRSLANEKDVTQAELIVMLLEIHGGKVPERQEVKDQVESDWECECDFGSYLKDAQKIYCRCSYPSVKKWLPKTRLVRPEVCDKCYSTSIQRIQEWIARRERIDEATREPSESIQGSEPMLKETSGKKVLKVWCKKMAIGRDDRTDGAYITGDECKERCPGNQRLACAEKRRRMGIHKGKTTLRYPSRLHNNHVRKDA